MTSSAAPKGKGIHGAIKHLLEEQYAFVGGDRVQDMLIGDLIKIFQQYSRDPWNLEVGQTLWFAVHIDEKPGPGKTLAKMRVVPTILSLTHEEDKQMRTNGYSHQEVRRYRVARMLKEAYAQNGVLTQADVAELIGVSAGTIGKDIKAYQTEQGIIFVTSGPKVHNPGGLKVHTSTSLASNLKGCGDVAGRRVPHVKRSLQTGIEHQRDRPSNGLQSQDSKQIRER